MKSIQLSDRSIEEVFQQIEQQIDGKLIKNNGDYNFQTRCTGIQGDFSGSCYNNSVSFIKCNLSLKEQISVCLKPSEHTNFLYFIYCNKGKLTHEINDRGLYRPIYENQTVVINPGSSGIRIHFLKDYIQQLIFIKVNPLVYLRKEKFKTNLDVNLPALFKDYNPKVGYTHYGNFNFKICDYFNEIESQNDSGLSKHIYLEGQVKLILAMLIKQYNSDIYNENKKQALSSLELRKIKQVSDYIKKNPSAPHTIRNLTMKFMISPSKLQKGFKILHNRTVSNYIKNLRIEIAEDMIKKNDCTISEIVYDIGFTSRSYFSKIFKEKYRCSPKNYQELIRLG